jgi:hypothetical protein
MKSKPGAAMVEMADGYAVDRAITHLNNNFMFGQKMNVWWVLSSEKMDRGVISVVIEIRVLT